MFTCFRVVMVGIVVGLLTMCASPPKSGGGGVLVAKRDPVIYSNGKILCVKHDGLALTKVQINDKSCWMVVDTGATNTVIRSDLAKAWWPNAPMVNLDKLFTTSARQSLYGIQVNTIGNNVFRVNDIMLMMLDLRQLGKYKGEPIVGLLGMDVLAGRALSVNMQSGRVEMLSRLPSSGTLRAMGGVRVPIRANGNRMEAIITANGQQHVLLVDTGATNSQFHQRLWCGPSSKINSNMRILDVDGITTQRSVHVGKVQNMTWGSVSISQEYVLLDGSLGVLGGDVLSKGTLLFDLRKPEAWFIK